MYDYVKLLLSVEMKDKRKCVNLFLRTEIGATYSTSIVEALQLFAKLQSKADQNAFMNRRIIVDRTEQYIATYLERESGRLHDAILTKMTKAFLSGLAPLNPLSPSSDATVAAQQQFSRRGDDTSEYYTSTEYNEARKSACFTALRDIRAASATPQRNIIPANTGVELPSHTRLGDAVFSIYFLSFVAVKVNLVTNT